MSHHKGGFEPETNGFQFYAIANLDKTSLSRGQPPPVAMHTSAAARSRCGAPVRGTGADSTPRERTVKRR